MLMVHRLEAVHAVDGILDGVAALPLSLDRSEGARMHGPLPAPAVDGDRSRGSSPRRYAQGNGEGARIVASEAQGGFVCEGIARQLLEREPAPLLLEAQT